MSGQETGILSLSFVLLGVVAMVALWFYYLRAERHYLAERHRWFCATRGKEVELLHVRTRDGVQWLGVRSCSAFKDPEHVTCDKHCIKELNSGLARLVPMVRA